MEWPRPTARLAVVSYVVVAVGSCHPRPPPEVPLQGRWHLLAPGESLAQVARQYQVPLEDLLELNAIGDPDRVEQILDRTASGGYGVKSLLLEIALSDLFQRK